MAYRVVYLVYSIVFILLCTSSIGTSDELGENRGITVANVDLSQLCAQLYSAKTHVLIGEPFHAKFVIRNYGDSAVDVIRCAPAGSDYLNYEVMAPKKQPRTFIPGLVLSVDERQLFTLQPADGYSRIDDLTFDKNELLLNEPGEYILHAIYTLPEGLPGGPLTVRSNGICIVVEEPTGIDKVVYDVLVERIASKRKFGGIWSTNINNISDYQEIVMKYPQSKYTAYIRYYLAQALETYATDFAKDKQEITSYMERAITNYETVAESLEDLPLGTYARQIAGRCYAILGKFNIAEEKFAAAFCSLQSSTEDQLEILSWARDPYSFYKENKIASFDNVPYIKQMLSLKKYANALGYDLVIDDKTKDSSLVKGTYKWTIRFSDDPLPICGHLYTDMKVELVDSNFIVSPQVIAMLMAERYGKGMEKVLSFMLTPAK